MFDAKRYGAWHEKNSDPKALTFGFLGRKPNLGQFGPKTFGKGLIKTLVENPSSNFHKQDLIFSRIMRWMQWNNKMSRNVLILGSGTEKQHLGHLGPEDVSSHMSRTLAPIFTNRTSFFRESSCRFLNFSKFPKLKTEHLQHEIYFFSNMRNKWFRK